MAVISKDLGAVTAYAAAVNRGYTGTKEEFETLMASYATVAEQAAESASNASQSATDASQSATDAETAKGTAQQAATDAQIAQASARESAQSAQQSAQSASQSAQTAESAKDTAVDAVDGFAAGAQQALDSVNSAGINWKSLAERQAENSEAYALGTRDGEDVGSSDPAYHNNAKYYAESVSASVQTATEAAQTATQKAGEAAQSASAAAESARTLTIDATLTQSGQAADAKATGDKLASVKSDLTVSSASVFENVRTNYPAVSYIHGASINAAGKIIADAGEIAFFSCVKGMTYKWNSLIRNRDYTAFYNVMPETGSTSYNDSRQSIAANTEFVAPITGVCAVYYHATTQTSEMKFWAVSNLAEGLDNLVFKLKRTFSRNLIGEENGEFYPVDIPAGVFNINVSTSDGSNFSQTLYLGLYDAQKNLVDVKVVLGTTLSYRDVQKNTSTDVKYIMVEGANAVPLMVTVSYNAVGGAVAYEPYFYDAKSLTEQVHGILNPDVPSYYKSHIASKADAINELDNVDMQIGFITDEHYPMNAKNSPALMRYLWNNVPMNFIVNNGDVLVQEGTKIEAMCKITQFNAQFDFAQNHYYPVVGNHEHNNANGQSTSTQLSLAQVQLAVLSKKNNVQFSKFASYYVDDSLTECRYYFVGCKQNSVIYEEDLVWLLQSFKTIPNGYCVVLFSHIGLKYNSSYEVTGVQTGISILSMGLLAVANKSSYTYDHVVYNYSDVDAVPIAIFSGHVHFDGYYQYSHQNYSGYVYTIATTCDAYGSQVVGTVDRTAKTVNEQAFDVISIDKTNRLITMTRIGGGTDRTFTYSDYQAE